MTTADGYMVMVPVVLSLDGLLPELAGLRYVGCLEVLFMSFRNQIFFIGCIFASSFIRVLK